MPVKQTYIQKNGFIFDFDKSLKSNLQANIWTVLSQEGALSNLLLKYLDISKFPIVTDITNGIKSTGNITASSIMPYLGVQTTLTSAVEHVQSNPYFYKDVVKVTVADPYSVTYYMAKQDVPADTLITNTTYWLQSPSIDVRKVTGHVAMNLDRINMLVQYTGNLLTDTKYSIVFHVERDPLLAVDALKNGLKNWSYNAFILNSADMTYTHIEYSMKREDLNYTFNSSASILMNDIAHSSITMSGVTNPVGLPASPTILKAVPMVSNKTIDITGSVLTIDGVSYTLALTSSEMYIDIREKQTVLENVSMNVPEVSVGAGIVGLLAMCAHSTHLGTDLSSYLYQATTSVRLLQNICKNYLQFNVGVIERSMLDAGASDTVVDILNLGGLAGYYSVFADKASIGETVAYVDSRRPAKISAKSIGGGYDAGFGNRNQFYIDTVSVPYDTVVHDKIVAFCEYYRRGRTKGYTDATFIDPVALTKTRTLTKVWLQDDTVLGFGNRLWVIDANRPTWDDVLYNTTTVTSYVDDSIFSINSIDSDNYNTTGYHDIYNYGRISYAIHPAEFLKMNRTDQLELLSLLISAEVGPQYTPTPLLNWFLNLISILLPFIGVLFSSNPLTALLYVVITLVVLYAIDQSELNKETKDISKFLATLALSFAVGGFSLENVDWWSTSLQAAGLAVDVISTSAFNSLNAQKLEFEASITSKIDEIESLEKQLGEYADGIEIEYKKINNPFAEYDTSSEFDFNSEYEY